MQITLKFRDTDARTVEYYLQKRYNSKAKLERLAMVAIRREVANEAEKELKELTSSMPFVTAIEGVQHYGDKTSTSTLRAVDEYFEGASKAKRELDKGKT